MHNCKNKARKKSKGKITSQNWKSPGSIQVIGRSSRNRVGAKENHGEEKQQVVAEGKSLGLVLKF